MRVFVIMPFSETNPKHSKIYWTNFYKNVCLIFKNRDNEIKEMFQANNIEIHKASAPQGNIVKSIIENLKYSEIVIAVLTDLNPNVFYELGIRHSQSNNTIMLCEGEPHKIPFDLNNYGVGLYKDNRLRYKMIEQEIMRRLKEIALNDGKPDNPVQDFICKNKKNIHQNDVLQISIENKLKEESFLRPPKFYREVERDRDGDIIYKDRTFFTCVIDLLNYSSENITLLTTELKISFLSHQCSTKEITLAPNVRTSQGIELLHPNYTDKLTLEPKRNYQFIAAFIVNKSIPFDVFEVYGTIEIIDMYNKKHLSPEFKIMAYIDEPKELITMAEIISKWGKDSPQYHMYSSVLASDENKEISIDEIL